MEKICVEAKIEQIKCVTDLINESMEKEDFSKETQAVVNIAIDEIMSNIVFYSGSEVIEIEYLTSDTEVVISFADYGVSYNPLEAAMPDTDASAEERKIGGLGIFLVKELMDEVTYQNQNGRNILKIKKCISG